MASCYGRISAPLDGSAQRLPYLPIRTKLPAGTPVEIDYFRQREYMTTWIFSICPAGLFFVSEHDAGHRLLNGVIEEGLSWPFEETMDMAAFQAYFLSHAAFVVRVAASPPTPPAEAPANAAAAAGGAGGAGATPSTGGAKAVADDDDEGAGGDDRVDVWGAFYIKPNFPGRCSHVCNGGFITDPRRRRRGVARLMGHAFLRLAKDLGYRASYFNLVFRSNEASLRLWRGLGFTELAVVPKAGRLTGIEGLVDAIQFHYDLESLREEDLPEDLRRST